ncbi:regulator of g-protein signaling 3 isoform x1 [Limosa lapponica baueri]|uniref:Regulator of g-protein signaling 3 isoform x1 n=1 Tax=Limosa lapponica baueri TaxID=1758121 RepID=A0A2I0TBX4_LIMLA|nr:regulator of g-protein signaling 3 isoform x1 [Limosa lapponica baueri]
MQEGPELPDESCWFSLLPSGKISAGLSPSSSSQGNGGAIRMLETDAEKPGQMHSEDRKVAAGDAATFRPPAAEAPAPAESQEALGATQGPVLAEKQPVATKKGEEQPSSLPAFIIPELRLDSTFSQSAAGIATDGEEEEDDDEEEDEEDDDDEDSDEHYLERNEAKRSSMIETSGLVEGEVHLGVCTHKELLLVAETGKSQAPESLW